MQLVRLLPDGHRMKREVDMALDCVSETMTPMHYHLREIIISTYRQVRCISATRCFFLENCLKSLGKSGILMHLIIC